VNDLPAHEAEARGHEAEVKARSATRAVELAQLMLLRTSAFVIAVPPSEFGQPSGLAMSKAYP
jgi:hypothetical protein